MNFESFINSLDTKNTEKINKDTVSREDFNPDLKIEKEQNPYIEKQSELYELNQKLVSHLEQAGIKDAIIYEPHNPEEYWNPNNTRIAFCNEEPYSTDGNYEKGIRNIDSDTLDAWSDGNKTIKTEFDLNYFIRHALKAGKEISIEDLSQLKNDIKPKGSEYYNEYEEGDKSLHFNYRYSIPTDTSHEHTGYIQEQYKNDPFYAQYYKEFLETTDPEILVIGSKFGTELYTQIYPELQGKLTYCGEPVYHNGRLVISIPHPSRISNEGIMDVVNKIVKNYDNLDKSKALENASSEFNPDKFIEKENITLAGVERGREMTFTEADSGHVNPNLEECEGFQCNCQTCVVVFEARLRGYDIEAQPMEEGSNAMQLSEKTNLAWLTPEGNHPDYIMNFDANSVDAVYNFIDETVKPGERYTLEGAWKGLFGMGHIISVFKENTGNLVFYDPQINQIYSKRFMKEEFLPSMQKGNTEDTAIKLLRIDNLEINTDLVDSIVRRSENYA
jgi:hypothetical protein